MRRRAGRTVCDDRDYGHRWRNVRRHYEKAFESFFGGAAEALKILADLPEIALLFTDIVMPDITGRKLAEKARETRPDLKVLYTTGYTQSAVVHNGIVDSGVKLIGKPFSLDELAAKVRNTLDEA